MSGDQNVIWAAIKWPFLEGRKMWLDTLAPKGRYEFNRMMGFTSYWLHVPLVVYAFIYSPELRLELILVEVSFATGIKIGDSILAKVGTGKKVQQQDAEHSVGQ